jgi:hypothetical protein
MVVGASFIRTEGSTSPGTMLPPIGPSPDSDHADRGTESHEQQGGRLLSVGELPTSVVVD